MNWNHVLVIVVSISVPIWIICGVVIWKILNDCKNLRRKAARQKELYNGRTSNTGSIPLG